MRYAVVYYLDDNSFSECNMEEYQKLIDRFIAVGNPRFMPPICYDIFEDVHEAIRECLRLNDTSIKDAPGKREFI